MNRFEKTIMIAASPSKVWQALTNPEVIPLWMGDPEMSLEVVTTWRVGDTLTIKGTHHEPFINIGTVLAFDPERQLRYTHLSSVSDLPDRPENHSTLSFDLEQVPTGTSMKLTIENFPTEVIFKHLEFYWSSTLLLFKQFVEADQAHSVDLNPRPPVVSDAGLFTQLIRK